MDNLGKSSINVTINTMPYAYYILCDGSDAIINLQYWKRDPAG